MDTMGNAWHHSYHARSVWATNNYLATMQTDLSDFHINIKFNGLNVWRLTFFNTEPLLSFEVWITEYHYQSVSQRVKVHVIIWSYCENTPAYSDKDSAVWNEALLCVFEQWGADGERCAIMSHILYNVNFGYTCWLCSEMYGSLPV